MHYILLTFSLIMHYLYRYICILNVFIYVYGQLSAIKNLLLLLLCLMIKETLRQNKKNSVKHVLEDTPLVILKIK